MTGSDALNERLAIAHPAAWRMLSPLGRRMYFPKGITAQAAEAAGCRWDATIGQITNGRGGAMPLPGLALLAGSLPPEETILYAAQGGRRDLRAAWKQRLLAKNQDTCPSLSLPLVTAGLTNGLSIAAQLVADPEVTVLLPSPGWGNYQHIFSTLVDARLEEYPLLKAGGLDLDTLARRLNSAGGQRTVLVLNTPSNPIGFSPTEAQAAELAQVVLAAPGPLAVVVDDAYHGMVWEPGIREGSLFDLLAEADPERILAIKVDGATKELFFFGGRVGFLTFAAQPEAAELLEEKARGLLRATISSAPAISQAIVAHALASPAVESDLAAVRSTLAARYAAFRAALVKYGLESWPFNSGFFALVKVRGEPEPIRHRLLAQGVGTISVPEAGSLRIGYGSVAAEDIEDLVRALAAHAG